MAVRALLLSAAVPAMLPQFAFASEDMPGQDQDAASAAYTQVGSEVDSGIVVTATVFFGS